MNAKVILLARGTCGIGFIEQPERAVAGAVIAGNLFTWFMGWFFLHHLRYGATGGNTCTGRA